ncbi:MAG: MBL fold metallo-hydrolase [SAR324 cluster bacterium]|nr:MBL fold metallo-hydrolase [SAR324 cluster bacterium]
MTKNIKIRDSVVALFTYQDAIFIIERQPYLKAFPGYHSFPGGKVDSNESEQNYDCKFLRDHDPRLVRALCREIREEVNFDLEDAIEANQVRNISDFGFAITPEFNPLRFHARFFKIELRSRIDFEVDPNEAAWAGWLTAKEYMQKYQQGKILSPFPGLCAMRALAENPNVQNIGSMHLQYDQETEVPLMEPVFQLVQMPVKSNTLPPAERTNAFIVGDSQNGCYLIDPSPSSRLELEKLSQVLSRFKVTGIFLTHHHRDHHQYATDLARTLQVPMKMSEDSYQRIRLKFGDSYFENITVQFSREGEVLTQWIGKDVLVFEIPGHDEGQLGLAPASMEWFIVGDLIQGIGTVVISEPEGDMKKYFASLEKVIELNPNIIIPSHGIPMKSTLRLKETLEHRLMREKQILQHHKNGKSNEEILSAIYQSIDPRLLPAAMKNIESHLTKLKLDQLI